MIPKIIHCIWFGGNSMPELAEKCIASWKKYCPEYEIKIWDETNYDITKNKYMQQSYEVKKYGFTVDFARLDIVYQYGGIYLDIDVELVNSLDKMLADKVFMGFETEKTVALGLGFGAEPGNEVIKALMSSYDSLDFIRDDGSINLTPSPGIQTAVMKKYGLNNTGSEQIIGDGCHIYPKNVFNPYDMNTGKIKVTNETVSIHHYMASWSDNVNKRNTRLYQLICRIIGKSGADYVKKVYRKIKRK